jgi:DNA helicase-2/ATP-dependent DNA helicase PcrA
MDNKIENKVMYEIKKCIDDKQNFLLSGGAGSGKTYTLVKTIEYIREKHPLSGIACITFTEAATDEIKNRMPFENIRVSTIHKFLWSMIKNYQKPLRETILALIEQENNKEKTGIKFNGKIKEEDGTENTIDFEELKSRWTKKPPKIEYKEYTRIYKGIFSHDDLLKIAEYMFNKYPLLCKITCDKFKYILVDEYQDTSPKVINIFLESISKLDENHKACVGFYGDKMQAIYDDSQNGKGVGNIDKYLTNSRGCVKEILKKDNYRCSIKVIKLINKIRNDNIKQEPAHRDKNDNIDNKQGNVKFLYSNTEIDYDNLIEHCVFQNWDFSNSLETKVLFLTHRVAAKHSNFIEILDSYKEPLVDENGEFETYKKDSGENKKGDRKFKDRKDRLIKEEYLDTLAKHMLKIGEILYDFENKNYNKIIRIIKDNGGKINSHQDKVNIYNILSDYIKENSEKTIENVIDDFNENKILMNILLVRKNCLVKIMLNVSQQSIANNFFR